MTGVDEARVRAILGGERYSALFAAARRRIEEAGDGARTLAVGELDAAERAALADLMGWAALPGASARLDVEDLDHALRTSAAGASLREVLEILGGPLRDRRAERGARREERERAWAEARVRIEGAGRSDLLAWLDAVRGSGALVRAARASGAEERTVLQRAVDVALRLPARGQLLPVFASEVAGDPHALDVGTPLGALALRAAAAVAGWSEVPAAALGRRRLWQEVGIDCDPLSADVLVLGLRPGGCGRLARHLRESAADGEPRRVTLRELARAELDFAPGEPAFACENPGVVAAAADALGPRCAALVCLEGVPSTAATALLGRIASAGGSLRVRADFDWAGLRIAGQMIAATGARGWRFGAEDYLAALATGRAGPTLAGTRSPSPWDERLGREMARAGVSVPEERLVAELIDDLGAAAPIAS